MKPCAPITAPTARGKRESLFCPVEHCNANVGGYCGINGKKYLGMASAALSPMGVSNFMGNGTLGGAFFFNDVGAEGQLPMTEDWGVWRNCPHYKRMNHRN